MEGPDQRRATPMGFWPRQSPGNSPCRSPQLPEGLEKNTRNLWQSWVLQYALIIINIIIDTIIIYYHHYIHSQFIVNNTNRQPYAIGSSSSNTFRPGASVLVKSIAESMVGCRETSTERHLEEVDPLNKRFMKYFKKVRELLHFRLVSPKNSKISRSKVECQWG